MTQSTQSDLKEIIEKAISDYPVREIIHVTIHPNGCVVVAPREDPLADLRK